MQPYILDEQVAETLIGDWRIIIAVVIIAAIVLAIIIKSFEKKKQKGDLK